ncbi:hypothetical protein UF12_16770 [Acinetobacter calcoaceticus]|nr:hypothetical protein UF12_16770 [Acinetobacter calcoaceticus]
MWFRSRPKSEILISEQIGIQRDFQGLYSESPTKLEKIKRATSCIAQLEELKRKMKFIVH